MAKSVRSTPLKLPPKKRKPSTIREQRIRDIEDWQKRRDAEGNAP